MSRLAPTLEAYFTDRLQTQRQASPQTIAAYRDTWRLLLRFVNTTTGKSPMQLDVSDVNAECVGAFLQWLERERHNTVRTRNARLAAIHAFFHYAAYQHPEHSALIQHVLAIPLKRSDQPRIDFLTLAEAAALLAAVDRSTWVGRRDYTLLVVALQTGLRVSELTGLTVGDVNVDHGACVRCQGKGRKQRATPLRAATVTTLKAWLTERQGQPHQPLFPTVRGGRLSTDAVQWLLAKYAKAAGRTCPPLAAKHLTPHTLRHTCAMNLLIDGVDITVVALWLGHESLQTTQIYESFHKVWRPHHPYVSASRREAFSNTNNWQIPPFRRMTPSVILRAKPVRISNKIRRLRDRPPDGIYSD